jgi:hypothetical protein
MEELVWPSYPHTFKVVRTLFDQAAMLVEYTPMDTRLTKITVTVPFLPNFSMDTLTAYMAASAPNSAWFAQDQILQHGDALVGATQ